MSTRPQLVVEIAFTKAPFDASGTLTWFDVSSAVRGSKDGGSPIGIRRGRQNELGRVEAGTLSLTLDNRARAFDPLNTAGAYYPNVIPMKRIRVSASWNSTLYRLYTGYIESWEPAYPGGQDSMVRVRASDLFKAIGRTVITVTSLAPGEGSGNAIRTALLQIGWPATTDYSGTSTGQTTIAPGTYANLNGLQYIQNIADTENGLFFISPGGVPTFQERHYRLKNQSVAGIFGTGGETALNGAITNVATTITVVSTAAFPSIGTITIEGEPISYTGTTATTFTGCIRGVLKAPHVSGATVLMLGELPYESVTPSYDDTQIYNDVHVTRSGGTDQPAPDSTSQATYGPRNLTKTGLYFSTDTEALSMAQWLLYNYKTPVYRFKSMIVNGDLDPSNLWPIILGSDLSTTITARARPPGGGALISQAARIEAIGHTIDVDTWRTEWQLSLNSDGNWFTLDSATNGVLGTNQLAF